MSLKVVFNKGTTKKVTVIAGKAKHEYLGLNEIDEPAREQLRFFGHWPEIERYLPITPQYNDRAALQDAVQLAARGDISAAQKLVGVPPALQVIAMIEVTHPGRAISQDELLQLSILDLGSSTDMIAEAKNHGAFWSDDDSNRLRNWSMQARREGKVVNCVRAGQLLGRTPFAVLCKLVNLKQLDEDTAYKTINAMNNALQQRDYRRREQQAKEWGISAEDYANLRGR